MGSPLINPRHALTENALQLILQANATLRAAKLRQRLPGGTRHSSRLAESAQLEDQYAIFRVVSVTEAFLDATSLEQLQRRIDLTNPTHVSLLSEWELSSTSTWNRREAAFAEYHGIALKKQPKYKEVQAAVHVRNSIAHGLGKLTARQRSNKGLAVELARIDVAIGSGRLHLGHDAAPLATEACTTLIEAIDRLVPLPEQKP